METEELRRLFLESLKLRKAIEKCDKNLLPDSFISFPKGSGKDTSLLLAQYLKEKGFGGFYYVLGKRKGKFHNWLCKGDVIVDITADQFEDNEQKVMVMKNSEWHLTFKSEIQHDADFNILDDDTKCKLSKAYGQVLNNI